MLRGYHANTFPAGNPLHFTIKGKLNIDGVFQELSKKTCVVGLLPSTVSDFDH